MQMKYFELIKPGTSHDFVKYRRVAVKLVQPRGLPPLKCFFRLGYYAPSQ